MYKVQHSAIEMKISACHFLTLYCPVRRTVGGAGILVILCVHWERLSSAGPRLLVGDGFCCFVRLPGHLSDRTETVLIQEEKSFSECCLSASAVLQQRQLETLVYSNVGQGVGGTDCGAEVHYDSVCGCNFSLVPG